MNTAKVAAQRSKDPVCPVGACIASKDNVVVGVGHNCMPRGKDDLFDYWTEITDKGDQRKHKFVSPSLVSIELLQLTVGVNLAVCHAELNAIVNAQRTDLTDCTMYVTRIPCADCAKLIVQSNIKRVFYIMDKYGENMNQLIVITPYDWNLSSLDSNKRQAYS
ncbi:Deoxycytidylate deaminase, partial [Operophtera brumata]